MNIDTLSLEQQRLVIEREKKGTHCRACDQFVKLYKRPIHSAMAYALITLYKIVSGDTTRYEHVKTIIEKSDRSIAHFGGGDFAKLAYWGLIEEMPVTATSKFSGRTNGKWRITTKGCQFVNASIELPKYSLVYNERFLGHDGELITIKDCLGKRFNYNSLMNGTL